MFYTIWMRFLIILICSSLKFSPCMHSYDFLAPTHLLSLHKKSICSARPSTMHVDTDSALNQSFALASYASTLSPLGLVSALKGRQFLASMRSRAPSPSPSSVSSSSIPVPERRRLSTRGELVKCPRYLCCTASVVCVINLVFCNAYISDSWAFILSLFDVLDIHVVQPLWCVWSILFFVMLSLSDSWAFIAFQMNDEFWALSYEELQSITSPSLICKLWNSWLLNREVKLQSIWINCNCLYVEVLE